MAGFNRYADTYAPMIYSGTSGRDNDALTAYLSDPRSTQSVFPPDMSRTTKPGTNDETGYLVTLKRITLAPSLRFRELMLQLSVRPDSADAAARVSAIVPVWARGSSHNPPSRMPNLDLLMCTVAIIGIMFARLPAMQSADVRDWLRGMLASYEADRNLHGNNIYVSNLVCSCQARLALGMPTDLIAQFAIDWANKKTNADGWLGESRQQSTIYYTMRGALVLLYGQCLMRKLGHPQLSRDAQVNVAKTIDQLEAMLPRGRMVNPPTMFHERSGYNGGMNNISDGNIRGLRQMYAYAFQGANVDSLNDTSFTKGSFTYGDLRTILKAI